MKKILQTFGSNDDKKKTKSAEMIPVVQKIIDEERHKITHEVRQEEVTNQLQYNSEDEEDDEDI